MLLPVSAETIYKWTDEKGQVHFSQIPPTNATLTKPPVKIKNAPIGLLIEPVEKRRGIYCGSLKLVNIPKDDALLVTNIKLNLRDWSVAEADLRKELASVNKSSNKKKTKKKQEKLAEYTCRTKWARSVIEEKSSVQYAVKKRIVELEKQLQALIKGRDSECPADAKFHGKSVLLGDEAEKFMKCYKGYEKKISEARKKIKNNKSRLLN